MSERDEYTRFRGASVSDEEVTLLWQQNETEFMVITVSMPDEEGVGENTGVKVERIGSLDGSMLDAIATIWNDMVTE